MFWTRIRRNKHNHVHYFRTLQGVMGMLRDSGSTGSVFDIEEGLRDIEASRLATAYLMSIPQVASMAKERYLRPVPDVDALAALPAGTLGYHYAQHLRGNGFDPDYYRKIDVRTDKEYLAMRLRQTHDIWHVVTGLGVDPVGELSVKACELAQTRRPMAAVITAGGLLRYLMKEPDRLHAVMQALYQGYTIGTGAAPLLAQKWEEMWAEPLDRIRERLAVQAGGYLPVAGAGAEGRNPSGVSRSGNSAEVA